MTVFICDKKITIFSNTKFTFKRQCVSEVVGVNIYKKLAKQASRWHLSNILVQIVIVNSGSPVAEFIRWLQCDLTMMVFLDTNHALPSNTHTSYIEIK